MYAAVRVLTWNLYHGRAEPPAGRDLQPEFAAALAGWTWDVALLQEVPPWWPPALARACDADHSTALTSRNALPALRRAIAVRAPDVIKSNGGGANAILVRSSAGPIAGAHRLLLRRLPERRVCHAVVLADGSCFANLHAQVHSPERAQADIERAAAATVAWSSGAPALLGGDFNVREPTAPGLDRLGGDGVDHVLGLSWEAVAPTELPERGALSDHAPAIVTLAARRRGAGG